MMEKSKDSLFHAFLHLLEQGNVNMPLQEKTGKEYCFMLHDEVLDEIQKVEAYQLHEWLSDGSFEKNDKLYISFLVKEF